MSPPLTDLVMRALICRGEANDTYGRLTLLGRALQTDTAVGAQAQNYRPTENKCGCGLWGGVYPAEMGFTRSQTITAALWGRAGAHLAQDPATYS